MLVFSKEKYKNQLLLNGLTSREVAKRANITEVTISRAVVGKQQPKPPTVAKIASVLNCTPADLLEEV